MSQPAIPPNCDVFQHRNDGDYFETICYEDGAPIWTRLEYLDGHDKENCRCRARCAWLNEATRLCECATEIDIATDLAGAETAEGNAEAWRKWGLA